MIIIAIFCVVVIAYCVKLLRQSGATQETVQGTVTEIKWDHSGYRAVVEYEYRGGRQTTTVSTKADWAGGLRKGDTCPVQVYSGSGQATPDVHTCWCVIVLMAALLIYSVIAVVNGG